MPAKTKQRPRLQCAVCGKVLTRLDQRHLKTHGLTQAEYERTFGTKTTAPISLPTPKSAAATSMSLQVATALTNDPNFVARLADEVGATIFGSSLRDQLRLALCSTLSARLELHGKAVASLNAIRKELDQPWRLADGGKNGTPTPTATLVAMAGEAHHEVVKTEEALLRAVRLASEEARHLAAKESSLHTRPAFTGEAEVIPVPPALSSGERETVRSLLSLLQREMQERADQREPTPSIPAGLPAPPSITQDPDPDPDPQTPTSIPHTELPTFPYGTPMPCVICYQDITPNQAATFIDNSDPTQGAAHLACANAQSPTLTQATQQPAAGAIPAKDAPHGGGGKGATQGLRTTPPTAPRPGPATPPTGRPPEPF